LQEIERAIQDKPQLIHYRILLGPPHSQVLKDHLLRLLALRPTQINGSAQQTLHVSILNDLARYPERFFVASEQAAVIITSISKLSHELRYSYYRSRTAVCSEASSTW
jgi:hypothetical protein